MRIPYQKYMQLLVGGERVEGHPLEGCRVGVSLHWGFGAFIAVGPCGGKAIVHPGVLQFHAAAVSIRQIRPIPTGLVIHFIRKAPPVVFQTHQLTGITQAAGKRPQSQQSVIRGGHEGWICGHHQIAARCQQRVRRKFIVDPIHKFPATQIHGGGSFVMEFDKFAIPGIGGRVKHDLVDHHVRVFQRRIRRIPGWPGAGIPFVARRSCLETLHRAIAPAIEFLGCQHRPVSSHKENPHFTIEIGSELHIPAGHTRARHRSCERHSIGKIQRRSQFQAFRGNGLRRGTAQLHPIHFPVLAKVNLVQGDLPSDGPGSGGSVGGPGGPVRDGAGGPIPPVAGAVVFLHQPYAVACSIGGYWPLPAVVAIVDFSHAHPISIFYGDGFSAIVQHSQPWAKDLDGCRDRRIGRPQGCFIHSRYENAFKFPQKRAAGSGGDVGGKGILYAIGEAPFRDIEHRRRQILQFDILRLARLGIVVDFTDHDLFRARQGSQNE